MRADTQGEYRMKIRAGLLVITLLMTAGVANAESAESAAQSAALAWLRLVDSGNYAQSWSAASSVFKHRVSEAQWRTAAANVRTPLGPLKSRKVQSVTAKTSLPGAPDGQYVVIQFASSFEHKAAAVETVTPMKDKDGNWHVSGYYIK
jgi:hypothetical protein